MRSVLSIQSHVVYGYVGNKAAVYPLQAMGFDVWPVNTVQFSNHTGYKKWQGDVFSAEQILRLIDGIFEIGKAHQCCAILSGYMGGADVCHAVAETVQRFRRVNGNLIYLCDPVIGSDGTCYVKPEVLDFFKTSLSADIITPNHYEAETLSGVAINNIDDLRAAALHFHKRGVKIVVITGVRLQNSTQLHVFASEQTCDYLIGTSGRDDAVQINGTGDLFSSVFLGAYLARNSVPAALKHAISCVQKAAEATIALNECELQVLSVEYALAPTRAISS